MTAIERKHGYTEDIVWSNRESDEWTDEDWSRLSPFGPAFIAGRSRFESIRQRPGERSARYVTSSFHEMRSLTKSGKRLTRWKNIKTHSYRRTAQGLVVLTVFAPAKGLYFSHHCWGDDDGEPQMALDIEDMDSFHRTVGELPSISQRFPLAGEVLDLLDERGWVSAPWHVAQHFVDAQNFADVAKSMYGPSNYRRPLGRALQESHLSASALLAPFRGLVPIDWIIDAYRDLDGKRISAPLRDSSRVESFRVSLRHFPQADLRRFLKEIGQGDYEMLQTIRDMSQESPQTLRAGLKVRDLGRARSLGEAHQKLSRAARAARRDGFRTESEKVNLRRERGRATAIRLAREARERAEYERLIGRTLTDEEYEASAEDRQRRAEEMERARVAEQDRERTEREREWERQRERDREEIERRNAESRAWHDEIVPKLHGLSRHGLRIEVAKDAKALDRWSDEMDHCIDSYAGSLGTEVLCGVFRASDGKLMLNIAASKSEGLYQCLGKHNRPTGPNTWEAIVSIFDEVGVDTKGQCWGSPRDGVPRGWSRDNRPVEILEEAPRVLEAAH